METTLDLLNRAMQRAGAQSRRELAAKLRLSPNAINTAALRGSVSPVVAGQLAELAGEDVATWMARAVLESAPASDATKRLRRAVSAIRNL